VQKFVQSKNQPFEMLAEAKYQRHFSVAEELMSRDTVCKQLLCCHCFKLHGLQSSTHEGFNWSRRFREKHGMLERTV